MRVGVFIAWVVGMTDKPGDSVFGDVIAMLGKAREAALGGGWLSDLAS